MTNTFVPLDEFLNSSDCCHPASNSSCEMEDSSLLINPPLLSFGPNLPNSNPVAKTVTLTNNGHSTVSVNSISVTGDFTVNAVLPIIIEAGKSATFTTDLQTDNMGAKEGYLTIEHTGQGDRIVFLSAYVGIGTGTGEQGPPGNPGQDGQDGQDGEDGEDGKNTSELWRIAIFKRADNTLETGQTVFPVPFEYLPNISVVSLNGAEIILGDAYTADGGPITLLEPITEDNDYLIVRLLSLPSIPEMRAQNTSQIGSVRAKILNATPFSMAFMGDSIPYCQDTTSGVYNPPINGATQNRSIVTLESQIQEAFLVAGASVTAINRGFPGDSTVQGLSRWADAAAVDMVWITYGHNDANGYGGHPLVSVEQYTVNMEALIVREIMKGAGVGIALGPNIQVQEQNWKTQPYRAAARNLAEKYGCDLFDIAECLQTLLSPTTDGIHLQSFANAEWGWMLPAVMLGSSERRIADGDTFYADDGLLRGGTLVNGLNSRTGRFIRLAPNQSILVAATFLDNVRPIIRTYQATATTTLRMYYAGGASTYRGLSSAGLTHDYTFPSQTMLGTVLRRGVRFFAIRNDGANAIDIESISFEKDIGQMSRGSLRKSKELSGSFNPKRLSASSANWWTMADFSVRLASPYRIVSRLSLSDVGNNGLAVWAGAPFVSSDFPALNALIVARSGGELRAWELSNLAPTAHTVVTGVFPAGTFTGEIELEVSNGTLNVYVDGVLKLTRGSIPFGSGYPGLIAEKTSNLVCHGLFYDGQIKEPY